MSHDKKRDSDEKFDLKSRIAQAKKAIAQKQAAVNQLHQHRSQQAYPGNKCVAFPYMSVKRRAYR